MSACSATASAPTALALTAAFLVQTPMGGNATRMGSLLLGPVLAFGLWRRQRFYLVLLVPVLIYWQWSPVVRDLEQVSAQPSVKPGFYAPLVDFLRGQPRHDAYRVEVLPEEHHWESAYVPRGIYIARGWERQLDRKLNPLFYQSTPLTGPAVQELARRPRRRIRRGPARARSTTRGAPRRRC